MKKKDSGKTQYLQKEREKHKQGQNQNKEKTKWDKRGINSNKKRTTTIRNSTLKCAGGINLSYYTYVRYVGLDDESSRGMTIVTEVGVTVIVSGFGSGKPKSMTWKNCKISLTFKTTKYGLNFNSIWIAPSTNISSYHFFVNNEWHSIKIYEALNENAKDKLLSYLV